MGLDYSVVDQNKQVKKNIAASMENVAEAVDKEQEEDFHELLPANTDILEKNLRFSRDYTYNNLKHLIKDESIVVTPGDKDSAIVMT